MYQLPTMDIIIMDCKHEPIKTLKYIQQCGALRIFTKDIYVLVFIQIYFLECSSWAENVLKAPVLQRTRQIQLLAVNHSTNMQ